MVVATGIELDLDRIPGMRQALDDPNNPAGTIYSHKYVYKVLNLRNKFSGGNAIFMNPMQPIKCGGAPQKIMYLSDYEWREKDLAFKTKFVSATPILFPACMKFSDALNGICDKRNIERALGRTITRIEGDDRVAYFVDSTGKEYKEHYDFLHIVPP